MGTITGTTFKTNVVNDSGLSATQAEYILDTTINLIVLFGQDISIPNMQGTVGSKSLTVSQKKQAAIEYAARAVYASFWKNAANTPSASVGNLSISNADLMSNPTVLAAIKEAAQLLRERDWNRSII